jgi:hypothetical protein
MSHKSLEFFSRAAMPREAYVMHFPAHRRMCKCHGKCTWIGVSELRYRRACFLVEWCVNVLLRASARAHDKMLSRPLSPDSENSLSGLRPAHANTGAHHNLLSLTQTLAFTTTYSASRKHWRLPQPTQPTCTLDSSPHVLTERRTDLRNTE